MLSDTHIHVFSIASNMEVKSLMKRNFQAALYVISNSDNRISQVIHHFQKRIFSCKVASATLLQ
jgi:ribosomal protein L30E